MWCRDRFGASHSEFHISNSALGESRPFDIPWMVLDHTLATETWDWKPVNPIQGILEEIARHAETNPNWLDIVT
jgi:CDP-paratose 2-epimerase